MASPAPVQDRDLELQLDIPLLEAVDNNWRICRHLPRRDSSLAAFLGKSADVLAPGILTLNVFQATHFLSAVPKAEEKEDRLEICFSSSNQTWKIFVLAIPFIMFPITLWISGMAKMTESDRRGLSAVSSAVIMEFIWVILSSALLTHCITEAKYGWVIFFMLIAIGLLITVWTITFNRPRCFRRLFCSICCCGRAPEVAAANANAQSIVAAELARQAAIAQEAFATQVELQTEASAASRRARQAADTLKVAIEEDEKALQDLEDSNKSMLAAKDDMNRKMAAKEEADRLKEEMETNLALDAGNPITEAPAHQSITEVEQNTSTPANQEANPASDNYSNIAQEADDAIKEHDDAVRAFENAEVLYRTASQNVVLTTRDAQVKKEEATEARQKVISATIAAESAYKKAAAARSVTTL